MTRKPIKLLPLGIRGTDLVVAGLRLGRHFNLADLTESYTKIRQDRGDAPKWVDSSLRNELQRKSSDCKAFHKEGHELDLIAIPRPGHYYFRDEVWPTLLEAANQSGNLLFGLNTLSIPVNAEAAEAICMSHAIGVYAQRMLMEHMSTHLGAQNIQDTSIGRAYDFTFSLPGRTGGLPQVMECKGTHKSSGSLSSSHNEANVWTDNPMTYWLGTVYSIAFDKKTGGCSGGELTIYPPLIRQKWQFNKSWQLELRPEWRKKPINPQRELPL
jgi:hypothetical protein